MGEDEPIRSKSRPYSESKLAFVAKVFTLRAKSQSSLEFSPKQLVELPQRIVSSPSLEEFEKTKDITYVVKEPFQYVNLRAEEDGEIVYNSIEPVLTHREKEILKKARTAFDMLININTVLVDVTDKERFIDNTFEDIIDLYDFRLTDIERQRIIYYIKRDYIGYGKVDLVINDKYIEDVSCNGPGIPLYVYHRYFESIRTNIQFEEVELNNLILRLAQLSGRHISILQPIRDASLPDGSRINMTLGKEVTKKGSTFTIRKFRSDPISPIEIMSLRTANASALAYLWLLVEYGRSLLVSGATAAGKTTFLNAVSMLIKPEYKIVSVEDTPEINLAHPNWIQAVTRIGFGESSKSVSGISGISGVSFLGRSTGDITLYDLLIAALRQRPDYIIVGEVRGEEAYTLFQAISVGHAAMGTIHAASMLELISRVESQPMNVPRVMVANLDLVIFLATIRKGEQKVRRVREIIEILGMNPTSNELITNVVFRWNPIRDELEFIGRSFLVEKIGESFGIAKEKLEEEIKMRTNLLELMRLKGILNYQEVTKIVRKYYIDREGALSHIKEEKQATSVLVQWEKRDKGEE
jgi:flagellar protein FlaI